MAFERTIWKLAYQHIEAGEKLVLCTILQASGSTPREVGARMLFSKQGILAGTIGGGCGEAEVLVAARKILAGHLQAACVEVDLSGDFSQEETQVCGGRMLVGLDTFSPETESAPSRISDQDLLRELAEVEAGKGLAYLITAFPGEEGAQHRLWQASSSQEEPEFGGQPLSELCKERSSCFFSEGQERYFVQKFGAYQELVIVGSGHVAQPLAAYAELLGYRILVVDDRQSFANLERFPQATKILIGKHAEQLENLSLSQESAVVIITRGHRYDEDSLRAALKQKPAYIGMIGSKRRALETLRRLREDGYSQELLESVYTPIGLDIGAETPEEIGLAIMAEIVAKRRSGSGVPLKERRPTL